jgi:Domain of unknown function (DUF4129)
MASGEAGVTQSAARPATAIDPPARASVSLRYARPIIVGLLLLVVLAGISAAGPAVGGRGPWRQDALGLGIGLEAGLGLLQIAIAIRVRRSPRAGRLATVLRSAVRGFAAAVMIVIVAVAVANLTGTGHGGTVLKIITGKPKKPPKVYKFPKGAVVSGGSLSYVVYALILLIVIIACVVLISRLRRRAPGGYAVEPAGDETEELRRAVESGRAALRTVDDARAAIIACYLAMEGSLARAGTARTVAETPDELLGRAAASGLIQGPAAARLTRLFYEARFSSHLLPASVKDDARQALEAISAELRGKTPAVQSGAERARGEQPSQPAGRAGGAGRAGQ